MESGQFEQHIKSCASTRVYWPNCLLSVKYNRLRSHKCIKGLQDPLRYYIDAAQRGEVAVVAADYLLGLDGSGMKYDLDGDLQQGHLSFYEKFCRFHSFTSRKRHTDLPGTGAPPPQMEEPSDIPTFKT